MEKYLQRRQKNIFTHIHKRDCQLKPAVGGSFVSLLLSEQQQKKNLAINQLSLDKAPNQSHRHTRPKEPVGISIHWLVIHHPPPGLIMRAPGRMAQGKQNSPGAAEMFGYSGQ